MLDHRITIQCDLCGKTNLYNPGSVFGNPSQLPPGSDWYLLTNYSGWKETYCAECIAKLKNLPKPVNA